MTISKAVIVQSAKRLRHLEELPQNVRSFLAHMRAFHIHNLGERVRALRQLLRTAWSSGLSRR